MKALVAVDGSKNSLDAVRCMIEHADWYRDKPNVVLITVHLPVPKLPGMGMAVGKRQIEAYYQEESDARLAESKRMLDRAGVPYETVSAVGPIAETVVKHAKSKRCDMIVIGTRGMTELGKALLGSTATKVLHISDIPVLLVK